MGRTHTIQTYKIPLILVALSFALTLHNLSIDSLWGDEIFTAIFAGQSPTEVISWTADDIHPPLYYLLSGTFTRLIVPLGITEFPTQTSDWLWRFPSVLFTVLTIAITYRLAFYFSCGLSRASRSLATIAALLLTLSPIVIKYAQEARMHALFMFFSVLSTWLLFRALVKPRRWTRWLLFALVTTANIYTVYFGFLILAAQGGLALSLFIANRKTQLKTRLAQLIGFTAATLLAFLLYLPWWPVLFNVLRRRAAVGAIEGGVGDPLSFLRGVVQALGPLPETIAWMFLLLFIIGLIFLIRHGCWPLAGFAALWLVLPTLLPIIVGDPRALQFRYAFVLPIYLTVIAYAVVSISNIAPATQRPGVQTFLAWGLATVSFIGVLAVYNQTKPDWRNAAAYLNQHTIPADIILIGPLWDEGRFIGYYYHGEAPLLTPAAMVTNIERHADSLRTYGGRVWAVNRFMPAESPASNNIIFPGVVVSEPQLVVYEPALLTAAAIDLSTQAVDAAYPWATDAGKQGVLDPDPRTTRAAALRALGDTLVAAGRPAEALAPYQTAVDSFPGWVSGYLALAETQETAGNLPAAANAYRLAVEYNLEWHSPQADEAAKLVDSGEWQKALETYHQIIDD